MSSLKRTKTGSNHRQNLRLTDLKSVFVLARLEVDLYIIYIGRADVSVFLSVEFVSQLRAASLR